MQSNKNSAEIKNGFFIKTKKQNNGVKGYLTVQAFAQDLETNLSLSSILFFMVIKDLGRKCRKLSIEHMPISTIKGGALCQ
jgi:hypothetical protein